MATGTGDIAKIWDLYTSINNSGDLDNVKSSLSKKYGTFTNSAAPSSGWGTGLCPSKTEWINLNSAMKKGDINIAGTYSSNQLVKYSDISYILRAAMLTLSASSYAAPVAGGSTSITVTFTNSDSYSVSSNQSWCTYTVNSNASGGTTTITAAANGTTSYRTATVTFSCVGRDGITISKSVTVTQYGKTTLSINPTSLSFTPAGGKNTSTATPANLSTYSVVSGDTSWCTVSKSSNTISVSATVNPSSTRSTTVYVHGKGDYDGKNITATIAVSQSSGISSISLSSDAKYGPADQSNKTASVSRTNISTYGVTRGSDSWITVTQSGDTVTYSLDTNPNNARTGTITVYGTGAYDKTKRTASIKVSQSSGIPTISLSPNTDWTMTSNAAATRDVSVSYTNASAYSVTASASWVTVSQSGNTVTLSVAKNTGSDRSTTVRFGVTGTYTDTFVYDDVIVNQEGVSKLTVNPTSWSVPLAGGSTTVTGSPTNLSTYYATSSVDWAKATKSRNTITISATSAIGVDRNGTITLYGTGDSDKTYRTATVSISQAAGSSSISLSSDANYTPDQQSNKTASVNRTNISTYGVTRGSDSWITVTQSGDTVTYSLEKNTSSARTGTITVYGTGTYDKTQRSASIKVSQSNGASSINIEANANYAPDAQSNKTATVTKTNVDSYTVSSNQTWCTVPTGNQTAGSISYSLTTNSGGARTATITVKGTGKYTGTEVSDSIKVSQSNGAPDISTNPTSLSFTKDGGSKNATVTLTNISTNNYTVSSNQTSWCTVTKSGTTVTVTCTSTNLASTRNATITISGTGTYGGSDSCTISVSQDGAPSTFIVSPTTWSMTSNAAVNKSFTVTSNNMGAFSVGSLASWLSVSSTASTSFTLAATKNNDGDRSDVIYVSAVNSYTGVGSTASITVSQEGKSILTVSPLTHTISPDAQSVTSNITATNMSAWYVAATSTGGWLTATKGTSIVTIEATSNSSTSRSGKVFVYDTGTSDGLSSTATITVTQNSGVSSINIESNANYAPAAQSNKTASVSRTNISTYGVTRGSNSWITVSQSGNTVTYGLTTNSGNARTGTITVYGTGDYDNTKRTDYIYVSQSDGRSSLSSSSSANYSPAAQSNKTAYVSKTNIDTYYATSSQSWCTVPTSVINSTSFNYSLTKNTGNARRATVTIYGTGTYDNTKRTAYIYISQDSGTAYVSTPDWTWAPSAAGGTTTKTVITSNVGSLIVSSNDSTSWASASISGNNVTLYAAQNPGSSRTATIYVGATGTYDISFKSDYFKIGQSSGISSIDISSSNATYSAAAQSNKTVSVGRTNITTYYATSSQSWCTVPTTALDSGYFSYSLSKNPGSSRTATITVYGTGIYDDTNRTDYMYVSQSEGTPSISLSKTSIFNAGATATSTNITVTHPNISTYYATASQDWITASKSVDTVTVSLSKNTGSARSGYVYVHGSGDYGGAATATISVSQVKGTSSISVSPTTMSFDPGGQSLTATITMTNMSSYTTSESLSWLTTSTSGNYVTLTATGNTASSVVRSGYIYFYGTGTVDEVARTASIYLSQNSGVPSITLGTGAITGLTPSDQDIENITINSSRVSSITASSSVTWVNPNIVGEELRLRVDENSGYSRYGYVYVHGNGTYGGAATASLYISQVSGVSFISVSPTSVTAPVAGTSYKIPVTLTNADTYTVSESYNWISTSNTSTTATITVSQNTSTSARTGYVYFYATGTYDDTQRSAVLTVRQPGATVTDPTVTMYVTNIQQLIQAYYGSYGTDESIYVCDHDAEITDVLSDYSLVTDLYYFDGDVYDTIYGKRSDWNSFLIDYDAVELALGIHWGEIISGYYNSWDGIASYVNSTTSFEMEWPEPAPSGPYVDPTHLSYSSSGGGQYIYAYDGYITSISSRPSWISTSSLGSSATSCLLTASANTSTSSRSGTVKGYISGQEFSVTVYQSGASVSYKSVEFVVEELGWMDYGTSTDLDLGLYAYLSGGVSYNYCNNTLIVNGYAQNGVGDRERNFGEYDAVPRGTATYINIYAEVRSTSGGTFKIVDDTTGTTLYNESDIADNMPHTSGNAISIRVDDLSGHSVIKLILTANGSSSGGGSSSAGTTTVSAGGWTTTTSYLSGYKCYMSNSNKGVNFGLATMRIYTSGKAGTFTIYIANSSEVGYDYTVASKLDTALPTSATATTTSHTSVVANSKGKTGTPSGYPTNWTTVSYYIPNTSQHWVEVAYRKDVSGHNGDDRGYCLVPSS